MIHCKWLYLQLFDIDPLIRVDISDPDVHNILKRDFVDQPIEAWYFSKASGMCNWKTMVILVVAFTWVAEIWMRIDPYDFQVLIVSVECMECWCSNSMVSSYSHHDAIWMFFESS